MPISTKEQNAITNPIFDTYLSIPSPIKYIKNKKIPAIYQLKSEKPICCPIVSFLFDFKLFILILFIFNNVSNFNINSTFHNIPLFIFNSFSLYSAPYIKIIVFLSLTIY